MLGEKKPSPCVCSKPVAVGPNCFEYAQAFGTAKSYASWASSFGVTLTRTCVRCIVALTVGAVTGMSRAVSACAELPFTVYFFATSSENLTPRPPGPIDADAPPVPSKGLTIVYFYAAARLRADSEQCAFSRDT